MASGRKSVMSQNTSMSQQKEPGVFKSKQEAKLSKLEEKYAKVVLRQE